MYEKGIYYASEIPDKFNLFTQTGIATLVSNPFDFLYQQQRVQFRLEAVT